jgi:DDE family transposase
VANRKGGPRADQRGSLTPQVSVSRSDNLGNLWRRLVLPKRIDTWSLTSVQQRLVKTGGRLVRHARYYWLLLAESHLTRRLFGSMLQRIWALPVPTG